MLEADRLAAFILTGSRRIDARLVAYNAATGVCRDHQRKGLGRRLLTHTMARLQSFGYQSYRLEVITTNTGARRLYLEQGFAEGRLLHSYTAKAGELTAAGERLPASGAAVVTSVDHNWADRMAVLRSHTPSWQNAEPAVDAIAPHCRIVTTGPAFGALVALGVHQDGLVHVSELTDRYVKDPNEVVRVRQQVQVRVLTVDPERTRIGLSMKSPKGGIH